MPETGCVFIGGRGMIKFLKVCGLMLLMCLLFMLWGFSFWYSDITSSQILKCFLCIFSCVFGIGGSVYLFISILKVLDD